MASKLPVISQRTPMMTTAIAGIDLERSSASVKQCSLKAARYPLSGCKSAELGNSEVCDLEAICLIGVA